MYAVVTNGVIGKQLRAGQAFTHPVSNIQYTAGWWRHSSSAEKIAVNIYPITEGSKKNNRYYFNTASTLAFDSDSNVVNRPYTSALRDLDNLKNGQDINSRAFITLTSTDWYIIREAETTTETPTRVLQFRRDVRTIANDLETQLSAVSNIGVDSDDSDYNYSTSLVKFVSDFTFPGLDDSDYDSTDDSDYDSDL